MENAVQKKGVGASVWRALWIRQSSTVSSAAAVFIANSLAFLTILINLRYSEQTVLEWFFGSGELQHSVGQLLDVATLTLCGLNLFDAIGKAVINLWTHYTSTPVALTPVQRRLLGIAEDDIRFQSTSTPAPASLKRTESGSPFSFGDLSWLFHLTPKKRRRSPGTPTAGIANNSSFSFYSNLASPNFNQSPSSSPYRVRFSPSVGANYQMATTWTPADATFEDALDSIRRRGIESSPAIGADERSPLKSILKKTQSDVSGLLNASIVSDQSVKSYGSWRSTVTASAHGQSPPDYRNRSGISETTTASPAKSIDFSSLSNYRYQPSQNLSVESTIGSPASAIAATAVGPSSGKGRTQAATDSADPVWSRYGIRSNDVVEEQILRLRLWISSTILKPLLAEIDSLNSKAAKCASVNKNADFAIGESSLLHLQSIVASKLDQYSTLGALLPYLELSSNQGYLLERLRELGKRDACLTEFRWNSGSQYKNKPWDDRLPSDSDLVMHLFATYMNSTLPLNPLCPEGKSFSALYFIQHPAKPPTDRRKGFLSIYQNSITPPNFQLLVGDETVETGKGKNNLFGTLLSFFHHLKSKCGARLDTLSLGSSGLNVLWVLE